MRQSSSRSLAVGWALTVALTSPSMATTLFLEDFQTRIDPVSGPVLRCSGAGGAGTYPFPAGWLLRNVDNRTPAANVAYVNEAWEVREDFQLDVNNCVAFSTSWYSPAGAANDWMWTPLIGPIPAGTTQLTWRARNYDPAYPDGYEVRVMTSASGPPTGGIGVIGNQLTNSTVVFSTAAEATTWASHTVPLAAYAGQSVYIGFRNNSTDKFLLVVDDVKVEQVIPFDPALLSVSDTPTQGYAKLPAPLAYAFDLQAEVSNAGTSALTGVVVDADLLVDGVPVDALTSTPIPALAPAATQTVTVGSSAYTQVGTWSVEALVSAAEGDGVVANSAIARDLTQVTADELTRAQGTAAGTLGIGAGNGGEMGQDFTLPVDAKLHAVRVGINNPDALPAVEPPGDGVGDFNGFPLELRVRSWNNIANEPGDTVTTVTAALPADAALGPLTLEFDFDGLVLPSGRYLFSLIEPTVPEARTLTLFTHTERYTPGTSWVIWPTSPLGGWGNLEELGAAYQRAVAITAVLGLPVQIPVAQNDAFSVPQSGLYAGNVALNDTPSDDGGNVWTVTSPPASGVLVMQATGAFEYTPATGAAGSTVTFGYSLCDVGMDCSTATVELQIQVNIPVALNDTFSVPQAGTFAGSVALNDTPSDDGGNVWTVTSPPASGVLVMQPAGAFEYTPAAGAAGSTVTFSYSLCDGGMDCSTATVELQIQVNIPVALNDAFLVPQSGTFAGSVAINDTPSDDGGNVWTVISPPASGVLVMQPAGTFEYTPAVGAAGSMVTFSYSLCDGGMDCSTATVELDIQVNLPVAVNDSFTVPPEGLFAGNVSLNDTPSDDGGNVWSVTSPPASGLLVMQPTGAFEYTPAAGFAGNPATFEYSLCDVNADCDTALVELQVLPIQIFADSFESPP